MTDDHPPLDAYLGGDLTAERTRAIDDHLLACELCWREVELARTARSAVRRAAEPVPADVRRRLQTRLADVQDRPAARPARRPPWWRTRYALLTGVIAVVGLLMGLTWGAVLWHGTAGVERASPPAVDGGVSIATPQPDPAAGGGAVTAAVMCFRAHELPGAAVPTRPAPDLTRLGLHVMAGGAGELAEQPTDAYAYASDEQSVFVFLAAAPFTLTATPTVDGRYLVDGLVVVAATRHPMLVVGTDPALVSAVAALLA